MARLTNAQLVAQLEAAHVSYELVTTERDSLRSELALSQSALAAQLTGAKPLPAKFLRYQPSAAAVASHDAYVAACQAARALAMRGGKSVLVSAR
jgi:hypothetical protein